MVDLRRIHQPQVIRKDFWSKEAANKWLLKRIRTTNIFYFYLCKGKEIKLYKIPWMTDYKNMSPSSRYLSKQLFSKAGDGRINSKKKTSKPYSNKKHDG